MKIEEIKALSLEELAKRLEDSQKELMDLRFKAATRQLANHRQIPKLKKTIARLNTVATEKKAAIGS
jgi:large subunit ribosomal protein L29